MTDLNVSTINNIDELIKKIENGSITLKSAKINIANTVGGLSDAAREAVRFNEGCRTKKQFIAEMREAKELLQKEIEESHTVDSECSATTQLIEMAEMIKDNVTNAMASHLEAGRLLHKALLLHKEMGEGSKEWLAWVQKACHVKKAQAYRLVRVYRDFGDKSDYHGCSMRVLNMLSGLDKELFEKIEDQVLAYARKGNLVTKTLEDIIEHAKHYGQIPKVKEPSKKEPEVKEPTSEIIKGSLEGSPDTSLPRMQPAVSENAKDEKDRLISELREQNLKLIERLDELTKSVKKEKSLPTIPALPQFSAADPHLVLGIKEGATQPEIKKQYRAMASIFTGKTCPEGAKALKAAKEELLK